MLKKIILSFLLAFHNIRAHFFHTLLSILGIVIGVAALVSILSLIDGMEDFAKEQISKTTSLNAISIRAQTENNVNGIRIRKDSFDIMEYDDYLAMKSNLSFPTEGFYWQIQANEVSLIGDTAKVVCYTTAVSELDTSFHMLHGRTFTHDDIRSAKHHAVATEALGKLLAGKNDLQSVVNKKITFGNKEVLLVGIARSSRATRPELFYPITTVATNELKANPPQCMLEAKEVIHVQKLKEEILAWLTRKFGDTNDFSVVTNEFRVAQATQGFQLFRIIMGLIVGISVLVGGIGVMNVLLISVTERTAEIGVRKAVGANKRDIIMQFLSESITVSLIGSLTGLVLGILGTMIVVPVVKSLTQMPFQASYTLNTLMVVGILAVVIGIVFGTYPAMRAARLDPVEAIRRE